MTTISALQPTERLRVYDLVREAGLDVSDWSNYKLSDAPAKNPKYCYEWSFIGPDRVVVCLWHEEMREDSEGVYQLLDYREKPIQQPDLNSVNKERCWRMDRAFRTAFMKEFPVRVIIVDGPKDENGDRSVKRRGLDSEPWHIASYDEETGTCRVQRGSLPSGVIENSSSDDTGNDLAETGVRQQILTESGNRGQAANLDRKSSPTIGK